MKLSVSAYRAQASAHKKILSNYQHQLSYGATNQASSARTPSDPATFLTGFKVRVHLPTFIDSVKYIFNHINFLNNKIIASSRMYNYVGKGFFVNSEYPSQNR